jgi:hypothetical protein
MEGFALRRRRAMMLLDPHPTGEVMNMNVDGVDLLGRVPSATWERFLESPYDLQVCSYFATGRFEPDLHNAEWLDGLLDISRMIPQTSLVKATFRRLGHVAPHIDPPGFNYLWIHSGRGFVFEDQLVDCEPGDVIRFARDREHGIVDMGAPFYRTNIVGQEGAAAIALWNSAFPTTCWFTDGRIYDRHGERSVPWVTSGVPS